MAEKRADIIAGLQRDILRMEGYRPSQSTAVDMGLGPMKNAFPESSFPLGVIHEFLSARPEDAASASGFIAGLLAALMCDKGAVLWISAARTLFPPALKSFCIQPDRCIFADLSKEKDVLWAMEEALKCAALAAVVGEMKDLSFIASRRLQLAVEQSRVTGFVLRHNIRNVDATACVSRWKITSLPGEPVDELPGVGFPRWNVELLKMRNGRPGVWEVKWINGGFVCTENSKIKLQGDGLRSIKKAFESPIHQGDRRKAG